MPVTVKIPSQLRAATGNQAELEADGGDCGRSARRGFRRARRPQGAHHRRGELRRFVNVYVGGEDIRYGEGLGTAVSDGNEITILPAVAGG